MFKREDLIYKDFGIFFCGGLLRVNKLKRLIDFMAAFGYVSMRWEIGMYMDLDGDAKVVNYMGGNYTHAQIKEIDDYAFSKGIEVVPCVQCFKHNGHVVKHEKYKNVFGGDGYLLAGEPQVYDLLKEYFETCKRLFRSRRIHIGMDETFHLGEKGYVDRFGYEEKGEIYMRHLRRVVELVKECGLECEMWGDMLKEMARKYRRGAKSCTKNYLADFPKGVRVVEWFYGGDYNHEQLKEIFDCFEGVEEIGYCDCINTYPEYHPHNQVGLNTYWSHAKRMKDFGINTYLASIWNDHHSCSHFAGLPAMFACSLAAHGMELNEDTKKGFKEIVGVSFDDFMLLDLVNHDIDWERDFVAVHLETSVFRQAYRHDRKDGVYPKDLQIKGLNSRFKEVADKLKKVEAGEFSLIFDSLQKLAEVMAIKSELGHEVLWSYMEKDREALASCVTKLDEMIEKLDIFIESFILRYNDEFQVSRFDICCSQQLGGAKMKAIYERKMINEYLAGKIPTIEILDEQIRWQAAQ